MLVTTDDVLTFWFGPPGSAALANKSNWWRKDPAFDAEVRRRFEATLEGAVRGELDSWRRSPDGRLAMVVVLDQFSRNMYRDTPQAFAQDPLAVEVTLEALAAGDERIHSPVRTQFLLMPLMHAEDVALQGRCIEGFARLRNDCAPAERANFEETLAYAHAHADIVQRFGRFPHRNAILNRPSTPEESRFLQQPNSAF